MTASSDSGKADKFLEFHGLGQSLWGRRDLAGAADAFAKALELRPNDGPTLSNLGSILALRGELDKAIWFFGRAAELEPGNSSTMENLGTALFSKKKYAEAEEWFRRALSLSDRSAALHNKLGTALASLDRLDEAIEEYQKAVAIKPDLIAAWASLGALLRGTGRLDESIASFRKGLAVKPDAHTGSGLLYSLLFHPDYLPGLLYDEHRKWDEVYARPLATLRSPDALRVQGRRIRIGYVSAYFCQHVVGSNLVPLLREHDHQRFEIFCYSHGNEPDSLTKRFETYADHWRDIRAIDDRAAADLIRADGIDILVDTALHMAEHRLLLFALKPAPIQVTFAGYPGTTGLTAMDCRLTDEFLDPPGQSDEGRYSERSIRLKSFWCFDPLGEELQIAEAPVGQNGFVTFGCLCAFAKVTGRMVHLWGRILRDVPGSRLILLAPEGLARQRVQAALEFCGVDRSRVEFHGWMPRLKYVQLYNQIDVFLDTFPYNGHSTMLDALWMGVAPVSLQGETPVSRGGLSILSNLGLPRHIAVDGDQYVEKAVGLANDVKYLEELRRGMRGRMRESCLMDAVSFARGVEEAFGKTVEEGTRAARHEGTK